MTPEVVYREHRAAILATLIRLLRDFDLAEEALQEAFSIAVEQWPVKGTPTNPAAWIISTARFKAIDILRRNARFEMLRDHDLSAHQDEIEMWEDDRLRLIFTCCHPALAVEAQVPLTLRTLCGLTTEEIARCFLVPPATMAQRIVRAKRKIRDAGIPYVVPAKGQLRERLDAVLTTIYLIFTEGYAATFGAELVRSPLCEEAIRLARLVATLLPEALSARALLAMLLLQDSRRLARTDAAGEIVLLEEQDRSLWDRSQISEGTRILEDVLRRGGGRERYAIEAAIAALHAAAGTAAETDWAQIAALYGALERMYPSPVVTLNRAVAVAMAQGPAAGLEWIQELDIPGYHLLPAVRADLLQRLGRHGEAVQEYQKAIALTTNEKELAFLQKRFDGTMAHELADQGGTTGRCSVDSPSE